MKNTRNLLQQYTLFAYITITLLGAYTAITFYAGTQFSQVAHAADVHIIRTVQPSK